MSVSRLATRARRSSAPWASTSTKNAEVQRRDLRRGLIGPETVNTLPRRRRGLPGPRCRRRHARTRPGRREAVARELGRRRRRLRRRGRDARARRRAGSSPTRSTSCSTVSGRSGQSWSRPNGRPGVDGVPVSVALVAGALAAVNPCGFPLLPAFLSFYVGADEERLPRAPSRALQGVLVWLARHRGLPWPSSSRVGLPVSYGATADRRSAAVDGHRHRHRARRGLGLWVGSGAGLAPGGGPRALGVRRERRARRDAAVRRRLRGRLARLHVAHLPRPRRRRRGGRDWLLVFAAYGTGMALDADRALRRGCPDAGRSGPRAQAGSSRTWSASRAACWWSAGAYLAYYWRARPLRRGGDAGRRPDRRVRHALQRGGAGVRRSARALRGGGRCATS